MAFCAYCGTLIPDGSKFCSSCGAPVTAATVAQPVYQPVYQSVVTQPVVAQPVINPVISSGLSVMLVSTGSCPRSAADDLISDICGYSDYEADQIIANTPITIAQELTESQATYLAQALSEYGMEVSVYDQYGYRTIQPQTASVFSSTGSLLTKVAAVLGAISIRNRISSSMIRRHNYPHTFVGTKPPIYMVNRQFAPRVNYVRRSAPRPAPVRVPTPRVHTAPPPAPHAFVPQHAPVGPNPGSPRSGRPAGPGHGPGAGPKRPR